jgi:septum site-determining protein MinD
MGRVIVVTSGKGGVGKTTITANLGIMLASSGRSVCVVDADIGLNNLDVVLGVENKIVYDLVDCIEGKCRILQALIEDSCLHNMYILPCCKIHDSKHIDNKNFCRVVEVLKNNFDFVLIDSPAGIGDGFEMASAPADEAIVVVNPHVSSIRDAYKVVGLLEGKKISNTTLIVNRVKIDKIKKKEMLAVEEIESLLSKNTVGIIPESEEIGLYNSFLTKLGHFKDLKVQYAFAVLCKNLINCKCEKYDYLAKPNKVLSIFKR